MSPEIVRLEKAPGAQMEYYTGHLEGGNVIGTIAFPVRDHMNAATVTSIIMSDFNWLPKGKTVDHHIIQGSILTSQRNMAIQRMRGDWLLYIDDDMTWRPDAIGRLVEAREKDDFDILSGLCFRRHFPYQPTLYMRESPTEGSYFPLEKWGEDEIVEVDATGCAFMLIHKRVFEMIAGGPMPPYEHRIREGGPPPNYFRWEGLMGEDIRFCQEAKAAGARIWVHTGIPVGHIAEIEINQKVFLEEIAKRPQRAYEEHKKINDEMGFQTMTSQQARERLGWK